MRQLLTFICSRSISTALEVEKWPKHGRFLLDGSSRETDRENVLARSEIDPVVPRRVS